MNVFDFDGTIYRGDSSVDFYFFCLIRYPWIILVLPYQLLGIALYKCGFCSKEEGKSAFFSFLRLVPSVQSMTQIFWSKNANRITDWYQQQKKESDVIISASPEFLLHPICSKMGIKRLIASDVDEFTGQFLGKNCYGEEKVRRFLCCFPNANVASFYSDSRSDTPMAKLAKNAYFVKKHQIISKW